MKSLTHEEMELALHKEDYSKYLYIRTIFGDRLRVICVPKDLVENSIYSSCDGVEAAVIQKDLVKKAILSLDGHPGLANIIVMYYAGGLKMREIGEMFGLTTQRISQLHGKAMEIMREAVL